jgi:hypothetical protein
MTLLMVKWYLSIFSRLLLARPRPGQSRRFVALFVNSVSSSSEAAAAAAACTFRGAQSQIENECLASRPAEHGPSSWLNELHNQ